MLGFRLKAQQPPPPEPVAPGVVTRIDHIYEVDPALMQEYMPQQNMPIWDTMRIVHSRNDYLLWMHDHFADRRLSGEQILAELERE